jgi:cardiolipin synthase
MNSDANPPSSRIFTIPNLLTLLRLGCIPLILLFLWQHDLHWALILFVAAGISDGLDGMLARWLKQKSLFGMYLDPVADKLLLSSCFLFLALTGELSWLVAGFVLGRDALLMVGVIVLLLATDARQFPPTVLGKANTIVQVAALFVLLVDEASGEHYHWLHLLRIALLALTPVLVVLSGGQYVYRGIGLLRRRHARQPQFQGS